MVNSTLDMNFFYIVISLTQQRHIHIIYINSPIMISIMRVMIYIYIYKLLLFYISCRETAMRRRFYSYTDTSPSSTHQSHVNEVILSKLYFIVVSARRMDFSKCLNVPPSHSSPPTTRDNLVSFFLTSNIALH